MVSIIIPIRYRADLTRVCLDSIFLYTDDFEIIVVQEGDDKEVRSLLDLYVKEKGVRYIKNNTPKGYAASLNAGIDIAKGDLFCFMNNDTVATPNWMSNMLKAFDDPEVGLVTPTFWGTGERQSVDWNDGKELDYVLDPIFLSAVCYVVRREVIEDIGRWDEQFFHGGEDIDFNIRLFNSKWMSVIARKSFIYHYGGASTRELLGNNGKEARKHYMEKIDLVEKKHNIDIKSRFNFLK